MQEWQLWKIQKVLLKLLQWLLCHLIQDLFILCGKSSYEFGIGSQKAAKDLTAAE
jgi:hypothetical protein